MGRSNAEATIYTERDGDAFAPGTSLARDHPDAAITPRPPSRRRRSRFRSATASRRSSLRRLGTESLHDRLKPRPTAPACHVDSPIDDFLLPLSAPTKRLGA